MDNRKLKLKTASFDVRCFVANIKNNSNVIMLLSLFACGLIIGTLSVKNSEYSRYLLSVFVTQGTDTVRMLINGSFAVIFVITINFMMGLCLVGAPLIYFMSAFEGVGFGALYGYRLHSYGYVGIGSYFATDLLFFILLFVIFTCMQYTAIAMSDSLKIFFIKRKGVVNLRLYIIKTAIFLISAVLLIVIRVFLKIVI